MKWFNYIIAFVVGVLITSIAFILYNNHNLKREIIEVEKPIVKVETKEVVKYDTIFKTVQQPTYITETIIRTDTIKADTILPYIQREYLTEIDTDTVKGLINAHISGYDTKLDTLTYNLIIPTRTITNSIEMQITKYKKQHWSFTVGVGCGYGLINKRADIFVGGIVGYSF